MILAVSLLIASCGNTSSRADVERAELLATEAILGVELDRIEAGEVVINDGSTDDPWPGSNVSAYRAWDTNGTLEFDLIAELMMAASDLGWTNLTGECNRLGGATVRGTRIIQPLDGREPFMASVNIVGPDEDDTNTPYVLLSVRALRATAEQSDPLIIGATTIDWGCLHETANP
ncbi:MAG: hypothetical protein GY939_16960 [Actinomycetia bacterium]|nr:hypothetical protein [Actinomycetes bacterium]